jgi:hypothetical protein
VRDSLLVSSDEAAEDGSSVGHLPHAPGSRRRDRRLCVRVTLRVSATFTQGARWWTSAGRRVNRSRSCPRHDLNHPPRAPALPGQAEAAPDHLPIISGLVVSGWPEWTSCRSKGDSNHVPTTLRDRDLRGARFVTNGSYVSLGAVVSWPLRGALDRLRDVP